MSEVRHDAAGQVIRVGDLAGGVVFSGNKTPVTVLGSIVALGRDRVRLEVQDRRTVTPRDDLRPHVGEQAWIYLERVFKLENLFLEAENESEEMR